MHTLLKKYKEQSPEIIFEWNDNETEARGWIVINSLRNGAAGGGTRMRKGLTKDEVVSLAKVMEIKFSVAGPNIGGAKSGIDFDPRDPRREEVLTRWYKAVYPLLKSYYGTGGDLNVDELKDVIPITEKLGLWHPQEGIVNGHIQPNEGQKIAIIGQLRQGVSKKMEDARYVVDSPRKYAVADMITGYGVAQSVVHYYDIFKQTDLKGKRVLVQGWGNVASAAACYLAQAGAVITGIIDLSGAIISKDGLGLDAVKQLFLNKNGNKLRADDLISFEAAKDSIWDVKADIFIPGAASKLVRRTQIDRLMANGLEVVSCGANVPFVDDTVFFGATAEYTDNNIGVIPDFIANCGMARVFAYLMQENVEVSDHAIFNDVSDTIRQALLNIQAVQPSGKRLSATALEIALNKLI